MKMSFKANLDVEFEVKTKKVAKGGINIEAQTRDLIRDIRQKSFKPVYLLMGDEPYYPVNDERNNCLAEQYRGLALREKDIVFGGRLAEYKYYDMAPVIEQVLKIEKF